MAVRAGPDGATRRNDLARALERLGARALHERKQVPHLGVGEAIAQLSIVAPRGYRRFKEHVHNRPATGMRVHAARSAPGWDSGWGHPAWWSPGGNACSRWGLSSVTRSSSPVWTPARPSRVVTLGCTTMVIPAARVKSGAGTGRPGAGTTGGR